MYHCRCIKQWNFITFCHFYAFILIWTREQSCTTWLDNIVMEKFKNACVPVCGLLNVTTVAFNVQRREYFNTINDRWITENSLNSLETPMAGRKKDKIVREIFPGKNKTQYFVAWTESDGNIYSYKEVPGVYSVFNILIIFARMWHGQGFKRRRLKLSVALRPKIVSSNRTGNSHTSFLDWRMEYVCRTSAWVVHHICHGWISPSSLLIFFFFFLVSCSGSVSFKAALPKRSQPEPVIGFPNPH